MPFFVLELCSDKKGHKKNLNKIEVLWNLGGERGIDCVGLRCASARTRVLIPLSKKKQA
jgi:hypothetical protein